MSIRVAVIIPAAGFSGRYVEGMEVPRSKLDEDLGGRPVLQRTVEAFVNYEHEEVVIGSIIVAGPHDPAQMDRFRTRHGDKLGLLGARIVSGGVTHRWETVRAALDHVPDDATHVAIHDGARPCVSRELLDRVFDGATKFAAVIPVMEVGDTIKRVSEDRVPDPKPDPFAVILSEGASAAQGTAYLRVEQTIDRTRLVMVQTPQVFERGLIVRAYAQDDLSSTDDAGLVERLGERVITVPGEARNIKITRPSDLALCRNILGVREPESRATHKRF
ncbi:MAG: 2-C-methyl-D-erythritol 4-phosphate cytidylyltransferase [Phycisphaeraceae bacterium]|nr:2-C-methyl-D-erythritol 4-phosphate cytidylyltransferase [Phycisphaeraceae bacterium]QYK48098.1 MAG: 2-C-methyl-D-erythritol 4-phosphate cytidylyltransferase [Phycisphaeraceae bacterium]